jgi:acyl-CoA thioester hydrolase
VSKDPAADAANAAQATFRFRHPVEVRFRDLDPMGHAHHSLVLIYIEEARAAYWREVGGRAGLDAIDYIMADVTLRFRARIFFPGTVQVGVRAARLGGSSFVLEYELRSATGELLADARSTQVMYDYAAARSKPIPPELRARIAAWDGLPAE